jgi:hypothetical protein
MKNTGKQNTGNSAISLLSAQKGKAFVAFALVGMMVFMWVRVIKQKSAAANAPASVAAVQADANVVKTETVKVVYLEMPVVKGRNDVLARDCFSITGWDTSSSYDSLKTEKRGEISNINEGSVNEAVKQCERELKLEAISSGKNAQAFINGQRVQTGQKLTIKKAGQRFEFEVVSIGDNDVVLNYRVIGDVGVRRHTRLSGSHALRLGGSVECQRAQVRTAPGAHPAARP